MTVDGAANPTPAPELPVLLGGRYLLGPLLGTGGAAEVFQAHDQVVDRSVAVKVFLSGGAATDARRQRREICTLAGFSHPGLVMVYDAGELNGRAYFVMQMVEGRTLAERLREGPLSVTHTANLGVVLAEALAYVHEHGVVHRDVKPGNVLLDHHDRPHLSDFGIATIADSTQITRTGMMIGTAAYLAPEQVRGRTVGPPADVYALGLLLLECLTGRREYPGNPVEAALARLHRRPEVPEELPVPMRELLAAMTVDEPDDRPTAADVAGWLQDEPPTTGRTAVIGAAAPLLPFDTATTEAVSSPAVGGTSPPPGSAVASPWRRRRRVLAAVVLVAALGSVLAVPLLRPGPGPSAPPVSPSLIPNSPAATGSPSQTISPTTEQPAPPPAVGLTTEQPAPPPAVGLTAEQQAPPVSPSVIPSIPAATRAPARVSGPTAGQPALPLNPSPIPSSPAATSPPAPVGQPTGQPSPPPSPSPPTTSQPVVTSTTPNPRPTPPKNTEPRGEPPVPPTVG